MNLADRRNEYSKASLDETNVEKSPFLQFEKWFKEASDAEVLEPNAMVLSTVDKHGGSSQRTVLLKKIDEQGFVFFTNYNSQKAVEINNNSRTSILFPWYALERQVIVKGEAHKISKAESLSYFVSRPLGSKLGAWVSQQSQVISNRSLLEIQLQKMKDKFKNGEVPLPDFWGGYRIVPNSFEFWQGRPNRLHDRIKYELQGSAWITSRLSP